MRTIKAVCVGAGNRGIIYSNFALTHPERMKVIAVVDPNPLHRTEFAKNHSIPENMQFASVEDFVESKTACDIV